MPTALLTGSAGFVGRHLHDALVERGYDNIGAFDIKDSGLDVRQVLPDLGHVDLAIHCAAVVGGRAKIDGAPLEVAYDFGLDSDFIQYCARVRPGRVVLFSSSAVYPVGSQQATGHCDLSEDHQHPYAISGQPDGVYGMCKLALEYQARELAKLGIPVHVFRPFSGYGADQDEDYPWPAIMRRVLDHEDMSQPFEIWSDPHQTRDWIHIDDIVAQVFACINRDVRGPINLCTGDATAFGDLVHLAFEACDVFTVPEVVQKPGMPSGVHYRVGNPTAINLVCPARTSVAWGIRRTMDELASRPETRTFLAPSCDRDPSCTQGLNHPGLCTRPHPFGFRFGSDTRISESIGGDVILHYPGSVEKNEADRFPH